jgi:hypothetical protein
MRLARLSSAIVVIALTAVFGARTAAFAASPEHTTVPELVRFTEAQDGELVSFVGEAIGEALRSKAGFVWVNVLENGTAVGVNMRKEMADSIDAFGEWSRTGSIVQVTGIVHLACVEHEGDFDVHASELRVISPAEQRVHSVKPWQAPLAIVSLVVGGLLLVRVRYARLRAARAL